MTSLMFGTPFWLCQLGEQLYLFSILPVQRMLSSTCQRQSVSSSTKIWLLDIRYPNSLTVGL